VGLTNNALAMLTYDNLEQVGPPQYGEKAREFGREIQRGLGLEPMEMPFLPEHERLTTPQEYEESLRAILPPWQTNFTSDDYVEYTWHAPTVRLFTARPALRPPSPGYQYPAWARNALGGVPEAIDPGMFVAGQTLAATLVDLLTRPETLARCQAEFKERTAGGTGGDRWVAPLLPRDFHPPIDFRWPEYINTARGDEWWVPTPTGGMGQRL
jgi:aminobenzoyl-glutamate utilization protein B